MARVLWLLALLLPACSGGGQATHLQAVDEDALLVWQGLLLRADDPPGVTWTPGESCKGLRNPSIILGEYPSQTCAAGIYRNAERDVLLVVPIPSETPGVPFGRLSSSGIVHEFIHASLHRDHGDPDAGHVLFPDRWELVPAANDWLRAGGL